MVREEGQKLKKIYVRNRHGEVLIPKGEALGTQAMRFGAKSGRTSPTDSVGHTPAGLVTSMFRCGSSSRSHCDPEWSWEPEEP